MTWHKSFHGDIQLGLKSPQANGSCHVFAADDRLLALDKSVPVTPDCDSVVLGLSASASCRLCSLGSDCTDGEVSIRHTIRKGELAKA